MLEIGFESTDVERICPVQELEANSVESELLEVEVDFSVDAVELYSLFNAELEISPKEEVGTDSPVQCMHVEIDSPVHEVGIDSPVHEVGIDSTVHEVGIDSPVQDVGIDSTVMKWD